MKTTMKIGINDERRISDIQEEFNKHFPYLKLEFFSRPHKEGAASHKKLMKNNTKTLGECRSIHNDGVITISPTLTVAELEQKFADVFGLNLQVFRKSGNVWLETTITDKWTLEEQNSQGEALTNTRRMI